MLAVLLFFFLAWSAFPGPRVAAPPVKGETMLPFCWRVLVPRRQQAGLASRDLTVSAASLVFDYTVFDYTPLCDAVFCAVL
jgi:hypothetical protein